MYCKAEEKVQRPASIKKVVVMGMGNALLKDEGVGIHVIHALQNSPLPANIDLEIIDGGTSPDILHLMGEADKLIIIDAVRGGSNPGSVYKFKTNDITAEGKNSLSLHELSLLESLEMLECMGGSPQYPVIIGVEPKEIGWGLELSSELEQKVPQIINIVLDEIREEARKC